MQFSLPWPPAADKCQSQMELRSRADLWGEYFRSLLLNIAVTQTALRNLVSYLKQKEAAGVISLQNRWGGRWDNIWLLLRFMFFFSSGRLNRVECSMLSPLVRSVWICWEGLLLFNFDMETTNIVHDHFITVLPLRVAGNLSDEGSKDDHLVVVVVRGG